MDIILYILVVTTTVISYIIGRTTATKEDVIELYDLLDEVTKNINRLSLYSYDNVSEKYYQLIMSVENKYDFETRHETALRLIKEGQSSMKANYN